MSVACSVLMSSRGDVLPTTREGVDGRIMKVLDFIDLDSLESWRIRRRVNNIEVWTRTVFLEGLKARHFS
jgi:hypothetical protein